MAGLACLVVACSARLEVLDLNLDSSCFGDEDFYRHDIPCAQGLLVRPHSLNTSPL